MSTNQPPPDARKVVDDLEDDVVDLDGLDVEAPQQETEDGTRAVPGTPEPPD